MSRSSSRRRTIAVAATLLLGTAPAAPAEASEGPDGGEELVRARHVWVPEPLAQPATFPVVDIESTTIDLVVVSQDLSGSTTVESSNERLDVTLDSSVLFGKDSAVLRPQARQRLDAVVRELRERGPGTVLVEGHTDDLGSAAHGYVLSRQRARSVLAVIGPELSGYALRTAGRGEDEPRVPNSNEENRSLNRRVEIHYTAGRG